MILKNLGIDVVERIAFRERRITDACHLRSIFSDEIGCISHIMSLLEQQVAPFQIIHKRAKTVKPGIVAVEFIAEPRIQARLPVIRLLDVEMEKACVDPFAEKAVHPLLHKPWIAVELRRPCCT